MSIRTASHALAFAPVRIGPIVVASIAALLGVVAAVKPDMLMTMLRGLPGM